ncbi:double-stranded RNA-binding protein 4-like [Heracleum sosnowskyi]|uniref:Double-stranded RNA-binding protein 4-like n=1 Tax=Heracleum sosnowskyi TaxID=360622 RepID=A0AAD8IMM5_9APIA|nr:double-stranded RNA-binding protein 4-like [Heracleum sosnowskyi]
MHKNKLQEYTQKSGLPLPVYTTDKGGFDHKPKFQATVLVDGIEYRSEQRFSRIISAENDVAKIAFDCIKKNMKIAGPSSIHMQDPKISKSILYEFAVKSKVEVPTYRTTCAEEAEPVFVSTCTFKGKSYTSEMAGSKKMAEQYAARKAIQSLLGNVLSQIIKSKTKPTPAQSIKPIAVKAENSSDHTTTTQFGEMMVDISERKRRVEVNNRGAKRVRIAEY